MARRDADLAAAKKNGGDGILLKAEQTDFLGTYSTGNATGLAVLSALQIRLTESDVIDSRHVYPGHADIKLVINVPLGEPPPAEQVELIQECRKGPAKRTNYVADPNPGAIGWNGGPRAPKPGSGL
jgi:hypothetical protein